jgi:hypothetical protein
MRSTFFPRIDEDNLMNRVDLVLKETGQLLSMSMDFKFIMYISNAVDQRVKKRQELSSYR